MHFSSGEVLILDFYVTLLKKYISAVLGYSWLSMYNPGINWKTHSIHFWNMPSDHPCYSCAQVNRSNKPGWV